MPKFREMVKNMEKVLIGLLAFVLILGAAFGVFTFLNKKNFDNMIEYIDTFKVEAKEGRLEPQKDEHGNWYFTTDEDFKVLHLTDVHLTGGCGNTEKDKKALNAVARMVMAEDPDLVIITGDISFAVPTSGTINNGYAHKMFIRLMENLGVYWTITLGNHDNEPYNFYDREAVADLYADESLERCLFMNSPEGVSGEGNHVINVKNTSGEVTQSMLMIDSHSYLHKGVIGGIIDFIMWNYDNIKQDQVDWYENMINLYNPQSSLIFSHIPLQEVKAGYDEYVANGREVGGNVSSFTGHDGEKKDVVYPSDKGDDLFEKILELDNTNYIFFGHDHFNNFMMNYKGVVFSYGYSIDYIAYGNIDKMGYQRGCTVIEFNSKTPSDITVTHENYYQEKYQSLDEMQKVDMNPNAYKD